MSYRKKFVVLGVLLFVLLTGILFRVLIQNGGQHEKGEGVEARKETEAKIMDKVEEKQLYHYKNLESLNFLSGTDLKDFEKILEGWITQNNISCSMITILGNISPESKGVYRFYLQLDDGQGTILEVLCSEQDDTHAYSIKRYMGDMPNIERIGGVNLQKEQAVTKAPADGYVPEKKATDDCDEIILDNSDALPEPIRGEEKELKKRVLEELKKKDELRRVFTVQNVRKKDDKIEFDLVFQTVRPESLGLKIMKNLHDGTWNVSWMA